MTSRTGRRAGRAGKASRQEAFTLIELILVMAILLITASLSAPSLSRFFRGRGIESEAGRFLSLTRYAQSRAASEGVPMLLWVDERNRSYGLQSEGSTADSDPKAVAYELGKDLEVETVRVETPLPGGRGTTSTGAARSRAELARQAATVVPTLRFKPDGSIGETSPQIIVIRHADEREMVIAQARNRLSYGLQTNSTLRLRR